MNNSHKKNLLVSIERVRRQNKTRDLFKKERRESVTLAQNKLFTYLVGLGKKRGFKPSLEREVYTKSRVRFADIFIQKYGLNIDVDGSFHSTKEQILKDIEREKEMWLKKRIITIRFTNNEIFNNFALIELKIELLLDELELLPHWKTLGVGEKRKKILTTRREIWKKLSKLYFENKLYS
jgi:very-short-patch-repair endonuclease